MSRRRLKHTALLVALIASSVGWAQAELHKFTSRDGERHFQAELVHYQPDRQLVEVRRDGGKLMKFRLDVLSEEDQKYVKERAPLLKIAKDLKVSARIQIGKKTVQKAAPSKTTTTPKSYKLTFRNTSNMTLEDLDVEYEIHWTKDNGSGRKGEVKNIAKGKSFLSSVRPREDFEIETDPVNIIYKEPYGST